MGQEKEQLVHKITLSTKKVVLLRDPKIKHQELAQKAVGKKAGDDHILYATMAQKELLKILLYQIDGKPIDSVKLDGPDGFDSVFSFAEFSQVNKAMDQIMGGVTGEFQVDMEITGKG